MNVGWWETPYGNNLEQLEYDVSTRENTRACEISHGRGIPQNLHTQALGIYEFTSQKYMCLRLSP